MVPFKNTYYDGLISMQCIIMNGLFKRGLWGHDPPVDYNMCIRFLIGVCVCVCVCWCVCV